MDTCKLSFLDIAIDWIKFRIIKLSLAREATDTFLDPNEGAFFSFSLSILLPKAQLPSLPFPSCSEIQLLQHLQSAIEDMRRTVIVYDES
jgi:hypothetical protein